MAAAVRAPAHPHTLRGGREGRMHISTPPRPARKTPPPALPAAAFKGKRRLHPRLAPRGAPCSCARPAPPRSARAASWVTRWLRRCRGGGVELERESGRRALSRRVGQTHATLQRLRSPPPRAEPHRRRPRRHALAPGLGWRGRVPAGRGGRGRACQAGSAALTRKRKRMNLQMKTRQPCLWAASKAGTRTHPRAGVRPPGLTRHR